MIVDHAAGKFLDGGMAGFFRKITEIDFCRAAGRGELREQPVLAIGLVGHGLTRRGNQRIRSIAGRVSDLRKERRCAECRNAQGRCKNTHENLHRRCADRSACRVSKCEHIGDEIILLVLGELDAEHQVEELHRIGQRYQTAVMQIGWRVLDAAQRERLDRSVRQFHHVVEGLPGL